MRAGEGDWLWAGEGDRLRAEEGDRSWLWTGTRTEGDLLRAGAGTEGDLLRAGAGTLGDLLRAGAPGQFALRMRFIRADFVDTLIGWPRWMDCRVLFVMDT